MFPTLWDHLKSLTPEVFFGGLDVPEYSKLEVADPTAVRELASAIRVNALGADWCGYIDSDGIHYHVVDEGDLHVDGSRDFVFLAPLTGDVPEVPSPLAILNFLQDPSWRELFVFKKSALYIEKTPATWNICAALDQVWQGDRMRSALADLISSEKHVTRALSALMKIHDEERNLEPSEMWEFWGTFWCLLIKERLQMRVDFLGEKGGRHPGTSIGQHQPTAEG